MLYRCLKTKTNTPTKRSISDYCVLAHAIRPIFTPARSEHSKPGVAMLAGAACLACGSTAAASALHRQLIGRVLRQPMEWFDTTPTGRILARFSNDINTVDTKLPEQLRQLLNTSMRVRGVESWRMPESVMDE